MLVCAAADGLLLQPVSRDRKPEGNATKLAYGSGKITQSVSRASDEASRSCIEAHGLVGR